MWWTGGMSKIDLRWKSDYVFGGNLVKLSGIWVRMILLKLAEIFVQVFPSFALFLLYCYCIQINLWGHSILTVIDQFSFKNIFRHDCGRAQALESGLWCEVMPDLPKNWDSVHNGLWRCFFAVSAIKVQKIVTMKNLFAFCFSVKTHGREKLKALLRGLGELSFSCKANTCHPMKRNHWKDTGSSSLFWSVQSVHQITSLKLFSNVMRFEVLIKNYFMHK